MSIAFSFMGQAGPQFKFPEPIDYEDVTVDATIKSLTAAKISASSCALIKFENGDIRATWDGATNPVVGGPGVLRLSGDEWLITNAEAKKLRMTREGATNGTARVHYYK